MWTVCVVDVVYFFFFFKQKTAYEMRISDWSSDVCSSDLAYVLHARAWRETSLLLELLTEHHGRIGLVARGVQGPKKHVLRAALQPLQRSEERRVGKECVSTCRSRWAP